MLEAHDQRVQMDERRLEGWEQEKRRQGRMNKQRIWFAGILVFVVMVTTVFALGGRGSAEASAEAGVVAAPDIEVVRHEAYQAFKAEATSTPEATDIEVLRHQAYQAFKANAVDEAETIDIEVLRHRAYQAFKAEATSTPETTDIEIVRHRAYQAFKAEATGVETVDIEVLRHQAYQAFRDEAAARAEATRVPETVDIEILRHRYYTYLKTVKDEALAQSDTAIDKP
jgi:hypothetical protein